VKHLAKVGYKLFPTSASYIVGNFGIVYRATLLHPPQRYSTHTQTIVAVKTLKSRNKTNKTIHQHIATPGIRSLFDEGQRMAQLTHARVMSLIGIAFDQHCTPYIITPYMCRGSVEAYVKRLKGQVGFN
jgi:hypothetical protein